MIEYWNLLTLESVPLGLLDAHVNRIPVNSLFSNLLAQLQSLFKIDHRVLKRTRGAIGCTSCKSKICGILTRTMYVTKTLSCENIGLSLMKTSAELWSWQLVASNTGNLMADNEKCRIMHTHMECKEPYTRENPSAKITAK
jgi:hypothetical protein